MSAFVYVSARFGTHFREPEICICLRLRALPKGPFGTKNAIALKIVVKDYRGSIVLSVPIRRHFSQEKGGSKLLSR